MVANLPRLIRLAHPMAFAEFLKLVGAPVESYFHRAGLPALCQDPNAYVPLDRAWSMFDDAARREGEDIAWHVGRFVGDSHLNAGLLSKLTGAASLLPALRQFILLVNSEASHLRLGIIEGRNQIVFFTTGYFKLKDEPGFGESQAYQLENYIALIRHFLGNCWQPKQMGICASYVPAVVRQQFPECRIRLNQPFSYIMIPRSGLHRQAVTKPRDDLGPADIVLTDGLNFAEMLALEIRPYLLQGYPSVHFAASLADTSVRTLSRRLSQCGTSYQALIDELRFSVAQDLLRTTDASIREVGVATGFSDAGNFSRLFRRVGGLSPREYRQMQRESQ